MIVNIPMALNQLDTHVVKEPKVATLNQKNLEQLPQGNLQEASVQNPGFVSGTGLGGLFDWA